MLSFVVVVVVIVIVVNVLKIYKYDFPLFYKSMVLLAKAWAFLYNVIFFMVLPACVWVLVVIVSVVAIEDKKKDLCISTGKMQLMSWVSTML